MLLACLDAQSCPTVCDILNCSLPGSSVQGIFQSRILEQVANSFSRVSSGVRDQTQVSCISCTAGGLFTHWAIWESLALLLSIANAYRLYWTVSHVTHQTPLSMGFSWQDYWSGLPCPSPGDLSNPGIRLGSPALQTDSLPSEPPGKSSSLRAGTVFNHYILYSIWSCA